MLTEINHPVTHCLLFKDVSLLAEIIHQNFTIMKNTFALLAIAGLAAWGLSSFSIHQNVQQDHPQKNRHIKITKIEDGKKIELDTVLSGGDMFVWNGDTINPEKDIKRFSPSEFDKIHHPDGGKKRHKEIRIYQYNGNNENDSTRGQSNQDNDVQIFTEEEGDSVQKKIILHKRLKDGTSDDHFIYFNGPDSENFPPMPPLPPMPDMNSLKGTHAEKIIDLNDPTIISFKKKKMSGDREKIQIIRKKSQVTDNLNFDLHMDDAMIAPEPPDPPNFENEFNNDKSAKKEIRKELRVKEKNSPNLK